MYIIVGLGNPTRQYMGTRHNIGFDAVTRIADDYNIQMGIKEHKAICGKGYIEGQKVLLAQPQTYMNLSGQSVLELFKYYKIKQEELIIIYDDISLDIGNIRIRKKGSAGGHNGIKDIISCLKTQEFPRIRIGIGKKPEEWDLADYVLAKFFDTEQSIIRETLESVSKACKTIIIDGMDSAMNKYNKKRTD